MARRNKNTNDDRPFQAEVKLEVGGALQHRTCSGHGNIVSIQSRPQNCLRTTNTMTRAEASTIDEASPGTPRAAHAEPVGPTVTGALQGGLRGRGTLASRLPVVSSTASDRRRSVTNTESKAYISASSIMLVVADGPSPTKPADPSILPMATMVKVVRPSTTQLGDPIRISAIVSSETPTGQETVQVTPAWTRGKSRCSQMSEKHDGKWTTGSSSTSSTAPAETGRVVGPRQVAYCPQEQVRELMQTGYQPYLTEPWRSDRSATKMEWTTVEAILGNEEWEVLDMDSADETKELMMVDDLRAFVLAGWEEDDVFV